MIKRTYKVEGMDCASCAAMIEMDLEDAGIKATCSFAQENLKVECDGPTITDEKIKGIVKNSGYKLTAL